MIDFNHLKAVVDDSLHPGTAPVWVAVVMAVLLVLLVVSYFKQIGHSMRRPKRRGYDACLAHYQKLHEDDHRSL